MGMSMCTSCSKAGLQQWVKTFKALSKHAKTEKHVSKMNQNLSSMVESTSASTVKIVGAKIAGNLCLNGFPLAGVVFDKLRLLCQDTDKEVQVAMIKSVTKKLLRGIKNELCETILSKKVEKLSIKESHSFLHYSSSLNLKRADDRNDVRLRHEDQNALNGAGHRCV